MCFSITLHIGVGRALLLYLLLELYITHVRTQRRNTNWEVDINDTTWEEEENRQAMKRQKEVKNIDVMWEVKEEEEEERSVRKLTESEVEGSTRRTVRDMYCVKAFKTLNTPAEEYLIDSHCLLTKYPF